MRTISAFAVILTGICLLPSVEAKDIIRDKSPDGKFALRVIEDEMGGRAAIIDLKSKVDVVELEIYQNYTEQAHLVWSKDSQRVAYFEPHRRGGNTTVYFRNGDTFEEVELPELPQCKNPPANKELHHVKTVESAAAPKKWLSSGALVLNVRSEDLMENEAETEQTGQTCSQDVTIAFDANHKASVRGVKQIRSD